MPKETDKDFVPTNGIVGNWYICYICKRPRSGYGIKDLGDDKYVCRKGPCRKEYDYRWR